MNLLEFYTAEKSTDDFEGEMRINFSFKDEFLSQTLTSSEFQNFIENKILKISGLTEIIENHNDQVSTFRDAFVEIFNSLFQFP